MQVLLKAVGGTGCVGSAVGTSLRELSSYHTTKRVSAVRLTRLANLTMPHCLDTEPCLIVVDSGSEEEVAVSPISAGTNTVFAKHIGDNK